MNWVLGVDPGADGGIARIFFDGEYESWRTPKSDAKIAALFLNLSSQPGCEKIWFENVWGRSGNSMRAVTSFMKGTGFLKGCIYTSFLSNGGLPPYKEVTPSIWQKIIGVPKMSKDKRPHHYRKREHKNTLKDVAQRLFPKIKCTLCNSDALLIALVAAKETWGCEIESQFSSIIIDI